MYTNARRFREEIAPSLAVDPLPILRGQTSSGGGVALDDILRKFPVNHTAVSTPTDARPDEPLRPRCLLYTASRSLPSRPGLDMNVLDLKRVAEEQPALMVPPPRHTATPG